jgi:hypothetical protein
MDGRGQQVAFREAILIFVYEAGAEGERAIGFGRAQRHQLTNDPTRLMRQMEEAGFPEAILNLVPTLIPFRPLSQETLAQIAQRTLHNTCERVYKQFGKVLEYEEPLLAWLLKSEEEEPLQPEDIQRKVERMCCSLPSKTPLCRWVSGGTRCRPSASSSTQARLQWNRPDPDCSCTTMCPISIRNSAASTLTSNGTTPATRRRRLQS